MISDSELLDDIRLTELELEAYIKIYEGFQTLTRMPENTVVMALKYNSQYNECMDNANFCRDFLLKLKKLKQERGL